MQQLENPTEQGGVRPGIDTQRTRSMPFDGSLELRQDAQHAIHDLGGQRGIGTAARRTAELGVERRRSPGIVLLNPMKNAGGDPSRRRNHQRSLLGLRGRARRLEGVAGA